MNDLRSKLESVGVQADTLRTLRDVAVANDEDMQEIRINEIEQQFPIYTLETKFDETLPVWQQLHNNRHAIEHTPVIIGDWDSLRMHWESREFAEMPEAYITLAKDLNVRQWFDKRYAEFYTTEYNHQFTEADILGAWKITHPFDVLTMPMIHPDENAKPNYYIGLIPTLNNWEIPAYMSFGCWNDCPCSEFQVAVQHYWHSRHDTEIVALLNDTMIMRVNQPVTERNEALSLAKDQMIYCHDVVLQGAQTLRELASRLIKSTYWYFWWD